MPKKADLTGMRFERLLVVCQAEKIKGDTAWLCQCDCGNTKAVRGRILMCGDAQSCGCLQIERSRAFNATRSVSLIQRGCKKSHPLYSRWLDMRRRCTKNYSDSYSYYGAKGVTVCDEWLNSFWSFVDYMGEKPSDKHTIDRIDPYGNYEPGNVRWATWKEQANNQRKHHKPPTAL